MKFTIYQESRIGTRQINQDRVAYCYSRDALLLVVADGMGGHARGEVAAQIATSHITTLFQREARRYADVNAGFVVIRCSDRAGRFFARVREALAAHPGENEQRLLNRMLFGDAVNNPLSAARGAGAGEVEWGYLPWGFYARTHGWPPPRRLALYHANYTAGADAVGQKIRQFRELDRIRRHPVFGRFWSCARRVPGAVLRRLRG